MRNKYNININTHYLHLILAENVYNNHFSSKLSLTELKKWRYIIYFQLYINSNRVHNYLYSWKNIEIILLSLYSECI